MRPIVSALNRWAASLAALGRGAAPIRPLALASALADEYERRAPSHQNAIDLLPGWSMKFPPELGLSAGGSTLFADPRIEWLKAIYGNLAGEQVLELGPLEAGHTSMLERAGAAVTAVEGNPVAYLKCLVTKEILGLERARFHLGDFNAWLERVDRRYDLIVASGVLYHMIDPLRLLTLMSERSDCLFIWTMIADDSGLAVTGRVPFGSGEVRLHRVPYGERSPAFCGGPNDHAAWLCQDDIVRVLGDLGYTVAVEHRTKNEIGASASFFARRS